MPARKRVRDRPRLLTDATWQEIIDARSAGMSLADCAAVAGIGKTTLIDWISDGRRATAGSPLAVFATDLEKARLTWKRSMLQVIARAADGGAKTTRVKYGPNGKVVETVETEHPMAWQAAAWLLERTWPEEFARVTRMEAFTTDTDETPGPPEVDVENVRYSSTASRSARTRRTAARICRGLTAPATATLPRELIRPTDGPLEPFANAEEATDDDDA